MRLPHRHRWAYLGRLTSPIESATIEQCRCGKRRRHGFVLHPSGTMWLQSGVIEDRRA